MNPRQVPLDLPTFCDIIPFNEQSENPSLIDPLETSVRFEDETDQSNQYFPTIPDSDSELKLVNPFLQNIVFKIHRNKIPCIDSAGNLYITSQGDDIHHIFKQEYFRRMRKEALRLHPFYRDLEFLFKIIHQGPGSNGGNFLTNLIWQTWEVHHNMVHGVSAVSKVNTVFGEFNYFDITYAFCFFNILDAKPELMDWLETRRHKHNKMVKQIERELNVIEKLSKKFIKMHPDLYRLWYFYVKKKDIFGIEQ